MKTYIITITLVVDPDADEQLQTPHGIQDEVRSWLTWLHAVGVHAVTVQEHTSRTDALGWPRGDERRGGVVERRGGIQARGL